MSAPFWPSTLPDHLLRDGYTESLPDGRLMQTMSSGPAKIRRVSSAAVRRVQGNVAVDFSQRATLERFWRDDLAGGVRAFWLRDQFLDGLPMAVEADGEVIGALATETDAIILIDAWWLCRFGEGGVSFTPWGTLHWQAAFTLEVLP